MTPITINGSKWAHPEGPFHHRAGQGVGGRAGAGLAKQLHSCLDDRTEREGRFLELATASNSKAAVKLNLLGIRGRVHYAIVACRKSREKEYKSWLTAKTTARTCPRAIPSRKQRLRSSRRASGAS